MFGPKNIDSTEAKSFLEQEARKFITTDMGIDIEGISSTNGYPFLRSEQCEMANEALTNAGYNGIPYTNSHFTSFAVTVPHVEKGTSQLEQRLRDSFSLYVLGKNGLVQ
mgnify:CR=1 FL=1|tara:strand:- start:290 stop:616 length:327 start_codon:yes stop_codon:yes gene_type:complete